LALTVSMEKAERESQDLTGKLHVAEAERRNLVVRLERAEEESSKKTQLLREQGALNKELSSVLAEVLGAMQCACRLWTCEIVLTRVCVVCVCVCVCVCGVIHRRS
jgi:hypothetical protein